MVVALMLDFILKLSFQVNDLKTQIRGIINDNEEMKLNQVETKLNIWDYWKQKSIRLSGKSNLTLSRSNK